MQISIISPCYQAENYIMRAYDCLRGQTHTDWEWIIIDDCSNDNSQDILNTISTIEPRIRLFRFQKNSGPSVCRNKGIEEAMGSYIAFLDIDDLWLPNKLEEQLQFMIQLNLKLSCHSYTIMSKDEVNIKDIQLPRIVHFKELSIYNSLATSFMMIKKEVIGETRFDTSLRLRQDWYFWFELLRKGHVCHNLPILLGKYRKGSSTSISRNKLHMAYLQWKMYRRYFKLSATTSFIYFLRYACYGLQKHFYIKITPMKAKARL